MKKQKKFHMILTVLTLITMLQTTVFATSGENVQAKDDGHFHTQEEFVVNTAEEINVADDSDVVQASFFSCHHLEWLDGRRYVYTSYMYHPVEDHPSIVCSLITKEHEHCGNCNIRLNSRTYSSESVGFCMGY